MTQRNLTITLQPDWKAAIRAVGVAAKADTYQKSSITSRVSTIVFGATSISTNSALMSSKSSGKLRYKKCLQV